MDYEITEKQLLPQLALTHRTPVTMETIGERIGAAFGVLMEHGVKTGAQWAGPPFILSPEDCEGEFEITVCMPVAPGAEGGEAVTVEEVPGGAVAATVHVGPYKGVGQAYVALQKWMTDNGRRPAGMAREVYLNDPDSVPPEQLMTEIDWPVE
jgi:effector-binding domain-containing protein